MIPQNASEWGKEVPPLQPVRLLNHQRWSSENAQDGSQWSEAFCLQTVHLLLLTASVLKRHMLTHTGEKPYVCTHCSYSSTTAGNLKTHLLTHSGEKTFQLHTVWIVCKGRHQLKKNVFFWALPESPNPPPPMTPIRATWSFFFGRQKRRFSAYYRTK